MNTNQTTNALRVYKPTLKAIRKHICAFTSDQDRIILHGDGQATWYNGDKIMEAFIAYRGKDSHITPVDDQLPSVLYAYEAEFISIKREGGLPFCDVVCDNARFDGKTGVRWSPHHITEEVAPVFDEQDRLISITYNGRVWKTIKPMRLSEYGVTIGFTSHQGEKVQQNKLLIVATASKDSEEPIPAYLKRVSDHLDKEYNDIHALMYILFATEKEDKTSHIAIDGNIPRELLDAQLELLVHDFGNTNQPVGLDLYVTNNFRSKDLRGMKKSHPDLAKTKGEIYNQCANSFMDISTIPTPDGVMITLVVFHLEMSWAAIGMVHPADLAEGIRNIISQI